MNTLGYFLAVVAGQERTCFAMGPKEDHDGDDGCSSWASTIIAMDRRDHHEGAPGSLRWDSTIIAMGREAPRDEGMG
jgi:hypothetical protein